MTGETNQPDTANDWDHIDMCIGSHFASYLINGDASGIKASEARALDDFTAGIQEGRPRGHWDVRDSLEFAQCQVTGYMSECVNVRYNFKVRA